MSLHGNNGREFISYSSDKMPVYFIMKIFRLNAIEEGAANYVSWCICRWRLMSLVIKYVSACRHQIIYWRLYPCYSFFIFERRPHSFHRARYCRISFYMEKSQLSFCGKYNYAPYSRRELWSINLIFIDISRRLSSLSCCRSIIIIWYELKIILLLWNTVGIRRISQPRRAY